MCCGQYGNGPVAYWLKIIFDKMQCVIIDFRGARRNIFPVSSANRSTSPFLNSYYFIIGCVTSFKHNYGATQKHF